MARKVADLGSLGGAPTVDFLENKKFHTNVWINTCSQAYLVHFLQRFLIVKFDNKVFKISKNREKFKKKLKKKICFALKISEKFN